MSNVKRIGVDLAKNVVELVGVDEREHRCLRERLRRKAFARRMAQLPRCRVVMEACATAHYWANRLAEMGHEPKLVTAERAARYRLGDKTDYRDAAAICEAGGRPWMPFVPIKSPWQLEWQGIHRIREQTLKHRNATANALRGLLLEHGETIPEGMAAVRRRIPEVLEDGENGLSDMFRAMLAEQYRLLLYLDERLVECRQKLEGLAAQCTLCRRLMTIPGVGGLVATAMVAAIGDGREFHHPGQLSAWLGIVPKEQSSGEDRKLGQITRRGNRPLRTLLIQGMRAALRTAHRHDDKVSQWARNLRQRKGFNKAAVALANKATRIIWALLRYETTYQRRMA